MAGRTRSWTKEELSHAAKNSRSFRQVLTKLGLREAGGNYTQIKKYLKEYAIPFEHFKGRGWHKGLKTGPAPIIPLEKILVENSTYQSYKLKIRLFRVGLKTPKCEECGWAEKTPEGYLPLELDHINGKHSDNRIENLRVLCPNCHSLKPTHRGRVLKKKARVAEWQTHLT